MRAPNGGGAQAAHAGDLGGASMSGGITL